MLISDVMGGGRAGSFYGAEELLPEEIVWQILIATWSCCQVVHRRLVEFAAVDGGAGGSASPCMIWF